MRLTPAQLAVLKRMADGWRLWWNALPVPHRPAIHWHPPNGGGDSPRNPNPATVGRLYDLVLIRCAHRDWRGSTLTITPAGRKAVGDADAKA